MTMVSLVTVFRHHRKLQYHWLSSPCGTLALFVTHLLHNWKSVSPNSHLTHLPTLSLWEPIVFSQILLLLCLFICLLSRSYTSDEIIRYLSFSVYLLQNIIPQSPSLLLQTARFHSFYNWIEFHWCKVFFFFWCFGQTEIGA